MRTVLPDELKVLDDLARNLRWTWHYPTVQFFASLDPEAWEKVGHDPVALLGEISPERFWLLAADPAVVFEAEELARDLENYMNEPKWYQDSYDVEGKPAGIAYFSAEFGLTEVMPQYSGGLGILAGDHLKSASDLGVPITGVGLLYGAGYFRQSLSRDGRQQETYPLLDPNNLPLNLLRDEDGKPALVSIPFPDGRTLYAQVWEATVGRAPLLLLDSNVPENDAAGRQVTDRLYGGSAQHRLEQELLLGVGGVRALRLYEKLGGASAPQVYHCNEGHAGFLSVERLREIMEEDDTVSFRSAVPQSSFILMLPGSAGFPSSFTKLVSARTRFESADHLFPPEYGVCLDIFPLDGVPRRLPKLHYWAVQELTAIRHRAYVKDKPHIVAQEPSLLGTAKRFAWQALNQPKHLPAWFAEQNTRYRQKTLGAVLSKVPRSTHVRWAEDIASSADYEQADAVADYFGWFNLEDAVIDKAHVNESPYVDFEGLRARTFTRPEDLLEKWYGSDWRTPRPDFKPPHGEAFWREDAQDSTPLD